MTNTKAGINIGASAPSEHVEAMTAGITQILEAGHSSHAEQETIQTALNVLSSTTKVEHVTITDCTITGDRVVEMPA